MQNSGSFLSSQPLRRYAAVLLCLAVFYLAAGGSLLHRHSGGQGSVCHVCQSLHAPALGTAGAPLIAAPEIKDWHQARPIQAAAGNEFSLHHAGRAPPSV
jgi:hypothetical protein